MHSVREWNPNICCTGGAGGGREATHLRGHVQQTTATAGAGECLQHLVVRELPGHTQTSLGDQVVLAGGCRSISGTLRRFQLAKLECQQPGAGGRASKGGCDRLCPPIWDHHVCGGACLRAEGQPASMSISELLELTAPGSPSRPQSRQTRRSGPALPRRNLQAQRARVQEVPAG